MSDAAIALLVLGVGVGGTLLLYLLIERETSNPRIVDRETAEREAKRRGGLRTDGAREHAGPPNGNDAGRLGRDSTRRDPADARRDPADLDRLDRDGVSDGGGWRVDRTER